MIVGLLVVFYAFISLIVHTNRLSDECSLLRLLDNSDGRKLTGENNGLTFGLSLTESTLHECWLILTFLAVVSVIMKRVSTVTVTTVAADRVLTLVLTSSVVHCAFVPICASTDRTKLYCTQCTVQSYIRSSLCNNNNNF